MKTVERHAVPRQEADVLPQDDRYAPWCTTAATEGPVQSASGSQSMLRALLASGARDRPLESTGRALQQYWTWLRTADLPRREALCVEVRAAVETGRCLPGVWVPVALGEHDFTLVRRAAAAYVGTRPISVDRLDHRVDEAIDWVRRGLALNRAAIFAGLLDDADEPRLERLASLRGRLSSAESALVWAAFDTDEVHRDPTRTLLVEWLAEWRATFGDER